MKVKIIKAYKMMNPNQEIELPDVYAAGLVKKGVAKEAKEEAEKKAKK